MDTPIDYAVFRFEKVKSLSELGRRSRHNNRTSPQGLEHTDPEGGVSLLLGEDDAVSSWHAKAGAVGLDQAKLRKDATYAIEWLASASPSWWAKATDEDKAEWRAATMAFLIEKAGGAENVLSAHLHEDESTPHIQALTIPLIHKEVAKRGRAKKGADRPKEAIWTLSANDYIGGHRDRAIELQTDYAAAVASLGIRRGRPRKETGARNMAPAKWRAAKAAELDRQREATETLIMGAQEQAAEIIATADERAEALHIGFCAVESGELAYRPQTADKPAALTVQRKDKDSQLPPPGGLFNRFKALVAPYLGTLTGYARRLAEVAQREEDAKTREQALKGREAAFEASPDLLDELNRRAAQKNKPAFTAPAKRQRTQDGGRGG